MSSELIDKLKKIIEVERDKIKVLAEDNFLKLAKEFGELTQHKFSEFPKVKHLLQTMRFYEREGLLSYISDEIADYEQFIEQVDNIRQRYVEEGSTIDQQIAINDFQNLIIRRRDRNYVSVSKIFYEILERIHTKYLLLEDCDKESERQQVVESIRMHKNNIISTVEAVS